MYNFTHSWPLHGMVSFTRRPRSAGLFSVIFRYDLGGIQSRSGHCGEDRIPHFCSMMKVKHIYIALRTVNVIRKSII